MRHVDQDATAIVFLAGTAGDPQFAFCHRDGDTVGRRAVAQLTDHPNGVGVGAANLDIARTYVDGENGSGLYRGVERSVANSRRG